MVKIQKEWGDDGHGQQQEEDRTHNSPLSLYTNFAIEVSNKLDLKRKSSSNGKFSSRIVEEINQ